MSMQKLSRIYNPKVVSQKTVFHSPWVSLQEKMVDFDDGRAIEPYYALQCPDYISILAMTPGGTIPVVHQYRPAIGKFTCELPAGLVEAGETPEQCCRRELLEETGLTPRSLRLLGSFHADTGRLTNQLHTFYVETGDPKPQFIPEPGMRLEFISPEELKERIRRQEFPHLLHIAALALFDLLAGR